MEDTKYLMFKQAPTPHGLTTKRFNVCSKSTGSLLGRIQWYPPWRQYSFEPCFPTVWNSECLETIKQALVELNLEHKHKGV